MFKEFLFICISLTPEQAVNFGGASNDAEKTVKQKLDVSISRAKQNLPSGRVKMRQEIISFQLLLIFYSKCICNISSGHKKMVLNNT